MMLSKAHYDVLEATHPHHRPRPLSSQNPVTPTENLALVSFGTLPTLRSQLLTVQVSLAKYFASS
jgi:hypothetical protein